MKEQPLNEALLVQARRWIADNAYAHSNHALKVTKVANLIQSSMAKGANAAVARVQEVLTSEAVERLCLQNVEEEFAKIAYDPKTVTSEYISVNRDKIVSQIAKSLTFKNVKDGRSKALIAVDRVLAALADQS